MTVDYSAPDTTRKAASRTLLLHFWLPQLATWGILVGAIAFLILHVLPNYAATSRHWKLALPEATRLLIASCVLVHRYRLWTMFPVLPLVVPVWLFLRTRGRPEAQRCRAALYSSGIAIILMLLLTLLIFYLMLTSRFLMGTDVNDPFGNPPGWMDGWL